MGTKHEPRVFFYYFLESTSAILNIIYPPYYGEPSRVICISNQATVRTSNFLQSEPRRTAPFAVCSANENSSLYHVIGRFDAIGYWRHHVG